jgi:hypothetical protein
VKHFRADEKIVLMLTADRIRGYIPAMNISSRLAAMMIGTLGATFAGQVPAFAETFSHVDARHDVEKSPQHERAPQYRKADVTDIRINHGLDAVKFTLRLRAASLKNLKLRVVGFKVRTPDHTFRGLWIAEHGATVYDLADDETGEPVTCDESSGRDGHTVWLRLDRACFDTPEWVRASVRVATNRGASGWGDNALSDNWRSSTNAVFSPRLHAGQPARR